MRTRVYVDGFNLYYGALKDTAFKWLDPVKLAYQLLPAGYSVSKLKYFTARVPGIQDAGAPARQQAYLNAFATLPDVEVLWGTFLSKTIWRPLSNLPVAGRRIGTPNRRYARRRPLRFGAYPDATCRHVSPTRQGDEEEAKTHSAPSGCRRDRSPYDGGEGV